MKNYCDFCDCSDCKNGSDLLTHAETRDGRWICSTCFHYEICQTFVGFEGNPCPIDVICEHRPTLVSEWITQ
jgi:hypothetical protein